MKVKCDNCGKEFEKKIAQIKRAKHNFCCRNCHNEFRKGKPNLARRRRITKECDNCSKTIEVSLSRQKTFKNHFCNKNCEYEWMKRRTTVTCENCGKEFERRNSQFKRSSYFLCSRKCSSQWHRLENSPLWRGGKSFEKYGEVFNDDLKYQIRERDNFTCQECYHTEAQLSSVLDIHHINYLKKDNRHKNLISLCKSCHSQTNFQRQDWTAYFRRRLQNTEILSPQLLLPFMEIIDD